MFPPCLRITFGFLWQDFDQTYQRTICSTQGAGDEVGVMPRLLWNPGLFIDTSRVLLAGCECKSSELLGCLARTSGGDSRNSNLLGLGWSWSY